jgi:SNARE protein
MGNKQELLDGGSFGGSAAFDNTRLASTMSNQELVQVGRKQMDQTDQTIERSKKVVEDTINIGAETASTLKGQVRGFPYPIEVQATMFTASIHASIQVLYRG